MPASSGLYRCPSHSASSSSGPVRASSACASRRTSKGVSRHLAPSPGCALAPRGRVRFCNRQHLPCGSWRMSAVSLRAAISASTPCESASQGRRVLALLLPDLLCELAEKRLLWGLQRKKNKPPLGVVLV